MSNKLVIKNEVVDSFVNDCTRGIAMLSSSKGFSENMAEAAGPNGGLRVALKSVEDEWLVRRGKLLDSFQKLVETISELRKKYEELDSELAKLLQQDKGGKQQPGDGKGDPKPPDDTPGTPQPEPSPETPAPGNGGGGPSAQLFGSAGEGAGSSGSGEPQPGDSSPSPGVELRPLPDQPRGDGAGAQQGSPLSSILAFADRWAALTGRKPEEVIALLVAGMGATGLIPATLLAQLSKSNETTIPGEVVDNPGLPGPEDAVAREDGSAADPGPTGPESGTDPEFDGDGTTASDADSGADAVEPGEVPEEEASDDAAALQADEPAVGQMPSPEPAHLDGGVPEGKVDPSVVAELQPESQTEAAVPAMELPGLDTPSTEDAAVGGGPSFGSGGLELPPLMEAVDPGSSAGASVSPLDLPDLTVSDSPVTPANVAATDLPDLAVTAPDAVAAGSAAAMAAPSAMQGVRGMSASAIGMTGGGAPVSSAPTGERSGSAAQKAEHEGAREVLEAQEEDPR